MTRLAVTLRQQQAEAAKLDAAIPIEADLVDCMVALPLPGQLFYSTQIPVCLWFLARNKRNGAAFPLAPPKAELPEGYAKVLADLKARVERERLRVVLAANSAMVLLYWDIGKVILDRQTEEGWGAKVIDRLAKDLGDAYPDMKGFSPRNLKYMRAFAAAWADRAIVQRVVARLPWRQNIALLERASDAKTRLWYAKLDAAIAANPKELGYGG